MALAARTPVFSVSGRIGRARYIAYGMGLPILIMLVVGLLAAFLGDAGGIATSLGWFAVGLISTGVLLAVWIVPAIALIGIVAAVSIPAYQEYVKRAQQQTR